jgi:two-component system, NtrC family, sensor kinase
MHVLIADDDNIARKLLKNMLERLGYEVREATDGKKAWALYQENPTAIVISDWIMPEMDGLNLCRKIRSADNETYTYVIILTARDQKTDLVKVFEAGADNYISKPFDPDELKARIKTGLRIFQLEGRHRKMQQTLVESRNKLRIVFDALQEEVVAIDRHACVVSANNAFVQGAGMNATEITGKAYFGKNGAPALPGANSLTLQMADDVFKTGQSIHKRIKIKISEDSERFKEVACLPLKTGTDETVHQLVFVSKDITEQHKNTQRIAALNKKLQQQANQVEQKNHALVQALKSLEETQSHMLQSEKMASIGQLAAGVAHEINNPTGFVNSNLATLLDYHLDFDKLIDAYHGFAQTLGKIEDVLPPEIYQELTRVTALEEELDIELIRKDALDLINDCREGTSRIKKIVGNLKDFAHPGEDHPKLANINECIASTLNVVNNELKYKAEVVTDMGELPLLKCLPQQLNQVFINILINSAQAMEDRGEIHIGTRLVEQNIEIAIRDTGSGISEENLVKIFDPFFTTKDVGQGTGLGMHIAYNIIQKHKGSIMMESKVGQGTTVTISLPTT